MRCAIGESWSGSVYPCRYLISEDGTGAPSRFIGHSSQILLFVSGQPQVYTLDYNRCIPYVYIGMKERRLKWSVDRCL